MKSWIYRLLKDDKEKAKEKKERITHPHMIKSKRHWDWDTGYSDIEIANTSNEDVNKRNQK